MHEQMNRDIRPPAEVGDLTPELRPLVYNDSLSEAFDVHEARAVRWKRIYMTVGITALLSSFVGSVLLAYQIVLRDSLGSWAPAPLLGSLAAMLSVGSTLFLLFGHPHERWLFARFQAEWLRCFKFRLFLELARATDARALGDAVAAATREGLARFRYEVQGGTTTMRQFSPDRVVKAIEPKRGLSVPNEWLEAAKRLYWEIRVRVQLQHFEARTRDKDSEIRPARSLGDLLFLAALVLTLVQLLIEGWNALALGAPIRLGADVGPALAFTSWVMFSATAIQLIYERARSLTSDRDRYAHFHREIERATSRYDEAGLGEFLRIVAAVEGLCAKELKEFCRDAERATFWH
jgi:hypothetical protein